MKPDHKRALGNLGETLAVDYLEKRGYAILERNYRTPYGEIDIISRYGETIVFVEVKTRLSSTLGPPEISITRRKQEHMRHAAEYYIQQHPELNNDWRVDVITLQMQNRKATPKVDHFENVIS